MKIKMDEWEKELERLRPTKNIWTAEVDKIIIKARSGDRPITPRLIAEFLSKKFGFEYTPNAVDKHYRDRLKPPSK
jgi:hypothetical protein